jgi:hypothetical protein
MTSPSNIPDAAVDAAAKAYYDLGFSSWEGAHEDTREVQRDDMRAALEAAAPHLMSQAWDEGEAAGQDNADSNRGYDIEHKRNPYRSQP